MPSPSLGATPSNCGKVLKALLPSKVGNSFVARVMTSGMVTTQSMNPWVKWIIRSQVLRPNWLWMQFTD